MKNKQRVFFGVLAVSCAVQGFGQENVVVNGSFENGWSNGPVGWGWTVNVGLGSGFSGSADGTSYAVVYGALFQDVATTPGQAYRVRYAVSGNSSFPGVSELGLSWDGSALGNVTWTSPNTTGDGRNYNWVYGDYMALATGPLTRISFEGFGSSWRPLVDDVSVTAVPEPGTVTFFAVGTFVLLGMKRRSYQAGS